MKVTAFLHGFCLALGLILPLGVQNLFVFQQGIVQPRFISVLPVIITAAACDTILILLSVGGISLMLAEFMLLKNILLGCGILFLFYMGYLSWRSDGQIAQQRETAFSAKRQVLFAVSVSLFNPYAFLDIIGVIGTSSLQYIAAEKIWFTTACILVSWLWFLGLGLAGKIVGSLDDLADKMVWINKISSLFIWGIALFLLNDLIAS